MDETLDFSLNTPLADACHRRAQTRYFTLIFFLGTNSRDQSQQSLKAGISV